MPDFIDECKTLLVALIPFIYLIVRNHTNFCLEKDGMYLPFISAVMICIKIIFCSVVFFKSVQFFVGFFCVFVFVLALLVTFLSLLCIVHV